MKDKDKLTEILENHLPYKDESGIIEFTLQQYCELLDLVEKL